ncbi:MAG: efflux RND transporter permease subunit, partial [Akkermansia sp.]|nr:efflux RND transporter permease subunit [Akkermansia sp.]
DAETPQIHLEINREKAQSLNIPVDTIFRTLQSVMASSYVNDFTLNGFNFKVQIQGGTNDRRTADDILNQMVRNEKGEMVPLSAVCSLSYRMGPGRYNRFNQYMSADISVTPAMGVGSGQIMQLIEQTIADMNQEEKARGRNLLWEVSWKDLSYQERQNDGKIGPLIAMAMIFAYLFLVAQYESWTTPVPVMLSVGVATMGALMGAQLFGLSMSIYVQLGLLMLIGLSAKNAILMVEFSKEDHATGTPVKQAAINGARMRYRAVLMTAVSFLFGVFPLVIATGSGAASRIEIGVTTFCGMLLATVFGIFMVPGLYSVFARMRNWTVAKVHGEKLP